MKNPLLALALLCTLARGVAGVAPPRAEASLGAGTLASEPPAPPSTRSGGFLSYDALRGIPYDVEYDGRSFFLGGERTLFLSGSVHPPRVPRGEWRRTLEQVKSNGLNMVQIYVFWNVHEPLEPDQVHPDDSDASLTRVDEFVALAGELGLFVNLRIGPYVCAEWKFGGLPLWLMNQTAYPGLKMRTDDERWMALTGAWFEKVVDSVARRLAPLGGPIALVQVENELAYDAPPAYVQWAGDMATRAVANAVAKARGFPPPGGGGGEDPASSAKVPVLMCEGSVAASAVPACNGPTCAEFLEDMTAHSALFETRRNEEEEGFASDDATPPAPPALNAKRVLIDFPGVWTENEGGYQTWGGSPTKPPAYFWGRGADDVARASMRWFARGGAHMNYYMFAGGNNFGATEGDAIATAYATDVNVCPDGLPNEPKFTHLARMHAALADVAELVLGDAPKADAWEPLPHATISVSKDGAREEISEGAWTTDASAEEVDAREAAAEAEATEAAEEKRTDLSGGGWGWSAMGAGRRRGPIRGSARAGMARADADSASDSAATAATVIVQDEMPRSPAVVAYVYESASGDGAFAAFLENNAPEAVLARFRGVEYRLPAASAVLLKRGGASSAAALSQTPGPAISILFNSSDVPLVATLRSVETPADASISGWRFWREGTHLDPALLRRHAPLTTTSVSPPPQVALVGDLSEYAWYHASFQLPESPFPTKATLTLEGRLANAYRVFVDGRLVGEAADASHSPPRMRGAVKTYAFDLGYLPGGPRVNALAILSESLGVSNYPMFPGDEPGDFEKGVVAATVTLGEGGAGEEVPFLDVAGGGVRGAKWRARAGLLGEALGVPFDPDAAGVPWTNAPADDASGQGPGVSGGFFFAAAGVGAAEAGGEVEDAASEDASEESDASESDALESDASASSDPDSGVTWLTASFRLPSGFDDASGDRLLFDASGLTRGHAWINGMDLGRYWNLARNDGSGEATQALYYVPAEWLRGGAGDGADPEEGENVVVLAEVGDGLRFGGARFAVARMRAVGDAEAREAVEAVTNGNQRACKF